MAQLEPLADIIMVEPIDRQPRKTESGLHLAPPKHEGPPTTGTVFAIGSGVKLEIKVGDRVMFIEPNPQGFRFEGKALFALKEEQIVGKIDKEAELW